MSSFPDIEPTAVVPGEPEPRSGGGEGRGPRTVSTRTKERRLATASLALDPLPLRFAPAGDDRLPRSAHVPGTGTAPDREPLEAAKTWVRRPVRAEAWESDAAYRYGAALYVNGYFWEAHEVWEAVWMACPPNGAERRFLRGLIQLANAALKLRMERPRAAVRLLREAIEAFSEGSIPGTAATFMGVPLAPLRSAAGDLARGLNEAQSEPAVEGILAPLRPVSLTMALDETCTIMHVNGIRSAL